MGPQYFSQVLDINQILSQFNGADDLTNLITFLDECTFSGDKKQSAQIKGFISELRKKHEAKFVNRVEVDNRPYLMMSSNTDTCCAKEFDDRRYFCTEVESDYSGIQDARSKEYSSLIHQSMKPIADSRLRCFKYRP